MQEYTYETTVVTARDLGDWIAANAKDGYRLFQIELSGIFQDEAEFLVVMEKEVIENLWAAKPAVHIEVPPNISVTDSGNPSVPSFWGPDSVTERGEA